jgi:hypothetical protein
VSGFGGLLNAGSGGGLSSSSSAASGPAGGEVSGGNDIFNLGRGSSSAAGAGIDPQVVLIGAGVLLVAYVVISKRK